MSTASADFNAIRISLASPEQIRAWSYGEVTKPETINYRTLRPEKDGLFCERIFGPTKDWECYCGKYKKIRYKGVVCDRCGVEVARAKVRRERMGHIKLAAPVAHIWFSKGSPSRLGLLLNLSPRSLERVLYFAQYIVTHVDEDARQQALLSYENSLDIEMQRLDQELGDHIDRIEAAALEEGPATAADPVAVDGSEGGTEGEDASGAEEEAAPVDPIAQLRDTFEQRKKEIADEINRKIEDLEAIAVMDLLTEARYRELRDRYGEAFKASMGAEAIQDILKKTSLDELRTELSDELKNTSGQRRKKAIKRLRVVEAFRNSGNKQEWMILSVLPVLPPELHPMVQLDGGRFATSDLNDLYRRVINRNNRLKHLIDLQAPDIIVRNEKRMLQEAVDALIDNGRRGRAIQGSHNHKLKSLTDLLRGKQGRFRQNLLGKRVDYSGRSVIIAGPELQLHECGLPKRMALELFKPFVMNALVVKGYAHNIKSAKRMAERARPVIWDLLQEVIENHPVLLNRAPTLHRLGIQAFQPVLVDGSAIQIHPLVCTAFNADFDGDQMAVHVPLSREAVLEAQRLMLSANNMLAPSSGDPIVAPTLDMVLGVYYLTGQEELPDGVEPARFSDFDDARLAHEIGLVGLREPVRVNDPSSGSGWLDTTVGRIILNERLPEELGFINVTVARNEVKDIVTKCFEQFGNERTAQALDSLKDLGFQYATQSGTTIAIKDIITPPEKPRELVEADKKIARLKDLHDAGLITEEERYQAAVDIWTEVSDKMTGAVQEMLPRYGGIYAMADSGAKGNLAQIKQMAGMRGLMSDPKGRIIEMPIRSSFAEGLSVSEYFISTHGARKGLADTALRTADSGYLTRRLADVAQEVIILMEDCGTRSGLQVDVPQDELDTDIEYRILGRFPSEPVVDPNTGEVIADVDGILDAQTAERIEQAGLSSVWVRSPLTCEAPRGLCQKCYGVTLATGQVALKGEAVGIIAAQSIGEPGTQLTMRTFHTGGIASAADITHGLPRVIELFEARAPKGQAVLSEISGSAELIELPEGRVIKIVSSEEFSSDMEVPSTHKPMVKTGDWADAGQPVMSLKKTAKRRPRVVKTPDEIYASASGKVKVSRGRVCIGKKKSGEEIEIPSTHKQLVKTGDVVKVGDPVIGVKKTVREKAVKEDLQLDHPDQIAATFAGKVKVSRGKVHIGGEQFEEELEIPATHRQVVKTGDVVKAGDLIVRIKKYVKMKAAKEGAELARKDDICAPVAGKVTVSGGVVTLTWTEEDEREYLIPAASAILIDDGQEVAPGDALTSGPKNPQDMLRIEGQAAVQRYMVDEVQAVYRSQGVAIHDKHIETVIRQMMRKVRVDAPGDTDLLPGELVDRHEYEQINGKTLAGGGEPATADSVLLGVTRASLNTDSFLAAASFQETAKVLTAAAVDGNVDKLTGLKENVIIGRLIPARLDGSPEGREKLGIGELGDRASGQLTGFTQAPATFEEALAAIGGAEFNDMGLDGDGFTPPGGNGAPGPVELDALDRGLGIQDPSASSLMTPVDLSSGGGLDDSEVRLAAEALMGSSAGSGQAVESRPVILRPEELGLGWDEDENGKDDAEPEGDKAAE